MLIQVKERIIMHGFFAFMNRMKYIKRWSLMRSTTGENIMEHSQQVSMLAHALAVINKVVLGGDANPEKAACIAMYHEASEVITGDLPTPIKYYNKELTDAYKELEALATERLNNMLTDELKPTFAEYLTPDKDSLEYKLVKIADKLAAYLKCVEEIRCGNKEFVKAEKTIKATLKATKSPELDYFMENFAPAFAISLDELDS